MQDDASALARPHEDSRSIAPPKSSGDVETTWKSRDSEELIEWATALAIYVARHGDSLSGKEGKTLYCKLLNAATDTRSVGSVSNWSTLMEIYSEVTTSATYRHQPIDLTAFCGDRPVQLLVRLPNQLGTFEHRVGSPWDQFGAALFADFSWPGMVRPV